MGFIRRWRWAILVALVLIVRIALPSIVRSQIETRASEALRAVVKVGDVDLAVLRGVVALEDVTVRATDAPPDEDPLIAWKRFAVNLRWLSLFRKTIRLSEIELVEPHVALDRLQSGDINLMGLAPKSEPAAETKPAEPSGWKFGIDQFVLRRGGVRFRDFVIPGAEPLAMALESIEVTDIAFEPDVYGGPADIKFVVKLDEGAVRTRARFTPRAEGMAVDVTLSGTRLPVHRSRIYVPGVEWSDLSGTLSMGLHYRLETGGRNELSGTLGLDDLTVWVGGLDEPALAWKRLAVALGKIDLVKHDARIDRVALSGAVVPARPLGAGALPVLTAAKAAQAAAKAADDTKPAEPAPPWSWSVGELAIDGSKMHLLSERPTIEVGVSVDTKHLSGPKHDSSPLKLELTHADGSIGLDGTLRLDPIGFDGSVSSKQLGLSDFLDLFEVVPSTVLQAGKLDSEAHVALGASAPTPGDIEVSKGTFALEDSWVAANDPKEFGAGAKRVAIAVDDVTVPGVFAKEVARGRPLTVALGSVELTAPYARITRTPTGIILPEIPAKSAAPATPPAPAPAKPEVPAKPPASAAPSVQVTVASVKLAEGRVDVMDRTVKPFYWEALAPIEVDLQRVRWPPPEIGALKLHAQSTAKGTIDVTGGLGPKANVELLVKSLPLAPFNPYVTGVSPYSISRGQLFVTTKAKIDGARYDTTTWLTLSDFDLASRTGDNVVLEQLGIPLTVAIALLRDWKGNIDLEIPVTMDEKGTQIGIGKIVTGALLQALVGTLMSPLKLVGAILPTGGSGAASIAPAPIRFHAGSSALDATGEGQVKQVASFLASRPGLGVTLAAPPTTADVRGLREQALLQKLGPHKGVIGTIRNVGARGRIVDALTARAGGEEGKLEDEDAKTLDEWVEEIPAPAPAELQQLGESRMGLVEKTLREQYGIQPEQISRAQGGAAEPVAGEAAVRVELGSARR